MGVFAALPALLLLALSAGWLLSALLVSVTLLDSAVLLLLHVPLLPVADTPNTPFR
jgi:hypothetical protein